jgi:hypothetical protein
MAISDIAAVGAKLEIISKEFRGKDAGYKYDGFELISTGELTREPGGMATVKAITVRDANGNIYVHFTGTGDGNWGDNAVAYGGPPSLIQEWALTYFNETIAKYYEGRSAGNLYVTGHSQGGNNAQYVTIRSKYSDYISSCITLDGPGFSKQFVEESKEIYGESYYERQRGKIWAYNGEADFVSPQGQVDIVPNGHTVIVATPKKSDNDNIFFVYHAADWLVSGETRLNPSTDESEFRKFVRRLVDEIRTLPDDRQVLVAKIAMKFAENYIGADEPFKVYITEQEFAYLKGESISIIVELLADNPEMITSVLQEFGIDRPASEAIEELIRHFNSYPPEARKKALQAIAQGITYENGKFGFDWTKMDLPAALVTTLPILLETILFHPDDIGAVIREFGIDVAIGNWIKEDPWRFAGICVGAALLAPIVWPIITVVAAVAALVDIGIRIAQGIEWLAGKVKDALVSLFTAIKDAIGAIAQWFRNAFNAGAKYANANPYFKVDTGKLREYATRVNNVNNRLQNLNGNLRGLYWQVGLLDIWDILCANILTSGSPTLLQVCSYLNGAADRFEAAENKVRGYVGG